MPTSTNPRPTSLVPNSRRAQPRQNDAKCRRFRKPSLPQLVLSVRTPFSHAAGAFPLRQLPKSTANTRKHLRLLRPSKFGVLLRGLPVTTTSVSPNRSSLPLWPPNTRPICYFSLENRRRPSHGRSAGPNSGKPDCAQTWTRRWGRPHPGPTPRGGLAGVRHSVPSGRNSVQGTPRTRVHFRKGPAATDDLARGTPRRPTPGSKETGR
jgi:hypothetical protein